MKKLFLALCLLLSTQAFAVGKIQNEGVKSYADIQSAVASITGNLSSGTACIVSPSSSANLAVGQFIYDSSNPTYIAVPTTIAGLPGTCSSGQIQMSTNATHNATGDTITFGGQMSQLINSTKLYDTIGARQLSTSISAGFGNTGTLTESAGAFNVDWSLGATMYTVTLNANATATFSNVTSGQCINVKVINTASNYTLTWPTSSPLPVCWAGGATTCTGTQPTQTIGAHYDFWTFCSDGTEISANVVQNF